MPGHRTVVRARHPPLANLGATRDELNGLHGWTLHQVRHSMLTHEVEARHQHPDAARPARHASVRSLERYARPAPSPWPATSPSSTRPPAFGVPFFGTNMTLRGSHNVHVLGQTVTVPEYDLNFRIEKLGSS